MSHPCLPTPSSRNLRKQIYKSQEPQVQRPAALGPRFRGDDDNRSKDVGLM